MAPSRAPAALHAGLQGYYFDGGCYPRGGGRAILDAFIAQLRAHGGELVLSSDVARILIENGAAHGVRLAGGREVRADVVVSNADPGVTWGRLVAPEHLGWRLKRRIEHMHFSLSTLSLFMAVDMDLRAAGLDSGNVWYSRTPDVDAAYVFAEQVDLDAAGEVPGLFFNATTLKDPSLRADGVHTVEAIALASIGAFARWKDTPPGGRGAEYRDLKQRLTERMLDAVEEFVPGLRERTVLRSLGTPLTNRHFLHASEGAIYGTEKTIGNLGPFSFDVTTHIRGLFQCGASTIAPGINGVTHSGLAAAAAALGCLPDDLLTAKGPPLRIYPADDPASWRAAP
jgi:phytoene dehydrogenase-like protein